MSEVNEQMELISWVHEGMKELNEGEETNWQMDKLMNVLVNEQTNIQPKEIPHNKTNLEWRSAITGIDLPVGNNRLSGLMRLRGQRQPVAA